jgi:hypothetical protein
MSSVGFYQGAGGNHAFFYAGGNFTNIDDPSATIGTWAYGISNIGQIVGYYTDGTGNHGNTYTTLDDPAVSGFTVAQGINDEGQVRDNRPN